MATSKNKKQSFFSKNIYYFIIGFILLAAITITVVLLTSNDGGIIQTVDKNNSSITPQQPDSQNKTPDDSATQKPNDTIEPSTPTEPVTEKLVFIMPVDNATVITDYTAASLVYNKTLNIYTGHLAIDFAADSGAAVKCVADGEVVSVQTSYLTGATITVLHENNVKTVYNSIEPDETLVKGSKVTKGQVIGTVSDNNKQEYKDGPHLHFEVYENDKKISPYTYLTISEK